QHERLDMLAEAADGEVVLAVNVGGGGAAGRNRHRSRHDRRPPTEPDHLPPELANRYSRFDGDDAVLAVETQNAIHSARIEHVTATVEAPLPLTSGGAPPPP